MTRDTAFRPGLPSLAQVQAHHDAQVQAHPELGGCARGCWMLRSWSLDPVQIYPVPWPELESRASDV